MFTLKWIRRKSETESERKKTVEERATVTRTASSETERKAAEKEQAVIRGRRGRRTARISRGRK